MTTTSTTDSGRDPAFAASPSSQSPLSRPDGLQSGVKRWSDEEVRLLIAMRREGIQRKVIARVLQRSPKSVKTRLEMVA